MWVRKFIIDVQENVWYASGMIALALVSVLFLLYELAVPDAAPNLIARLHYIDTVIATIFLTDFFSGLAATPHRFRDVYWRNNWLNLISSIPISNEVTQTLRLLRIVRAVRVIRVGMNIMFANRRWRRNRTRSEI